MEVVKGKPLAIRPGMEPDGYPDWLFRMEKEEEARKAAKETGALLLTGPAGDVPAGPAGEAPEVVQAVEAEPAVEIAVADNVALTAAQKRPRRH